MKTRFLPFIALVLAFSAAGCGQGPSAPTAAGDGSPAGGMIVLQAQVAAEITGVVFNDANHNGVRNSTETGIPGVTVWLDDSRSVVTGANGMYAFAITTPGTYRVEETDPPGYGSTTPDTLLIQVASGLVYRADFGDALLAAATYPVTGAVFADANRNGVMDSGETGISGVTVTLDGSLNVATNALGKYAFAPSALGPHALEAAAPAGLEPTTPDSVDFNLTAAGVVVNFGMAATGKGILDIKPGNAKNPLNLDSNGVTPAAILGSASLNVRDIDLSTLRLDGVAPLRWSREDVGGGGDEAGPDGFGDLLLKFDTQELAEAIGPAARGDTVTLHLTGALEDGTPITATETVYIVKGR